MKINNVIFDLDGTLLDTSEGIIESAQYVIERMGLKVLSNTKMLNFVGPPIQQSFMRYCGCTKEDAQCAADCFRDYYQNNALYKAVPYEGIYELLELLISKNIKIAVATYKREDYAIKLLRYFDFHKYFNVMHGADNYNKLTKADIILLCLDELNGKKSETAIVGDTAHDADGANNAGINYISVTYGFGFKANDDISNYNPIAKCDSVADLMNYFKPAKV